MQNSCVAGKPELREVVCPARAEVVMATLTFLNLEPITRFTNSLGF